MNTTQPRWNRIGLYTIVTLALWAALGTVLHHTWSPADAPMALACAMAWDAIERRREARGATTRA